MYWDDKYGTQSVSNEASCNFGTIFFKVKVVVSIRFLNFIWFAGGCSNERDLEQGQSEYNLKFILAG